MGYNYHFINHPYPLLKIRRGNLVNILRETTGGIFPPTYNNCISIFRNHPYLLPRNCPPCFKGDYRGLYITTDFYFQRHYKKIINHP
jgi:hypothetical protein